MDGAEKKLDIAIGGLTTVGPSRRTPEDLPYWGVIFNINRSDGVGTAIGITVRCEYPEEAKREAIETLKGFLRDAWFTADGGSIRDPEMQLRFELEDSAAQPED